MSSPCAVLFDVDGTLVDSNYLHVDAWGLAFETLGLDVPSWRIHAAIGKDSALLLQSLLGDDAASEHGEEASSRHSAFYAERMSRLRRLDGSRELLRELRRRGFRVVLATSAPADELAVLRTVLDCEDALYAVTSSADVDQAKPTPELIHVALDKAGVEPGAAIMVGDAVWDMVAARRAGVTGIGVLSGGIGEGELRSEGAAAIYTDPANLLERLDASPIASLPRA